MHSRQEIIQQITKLKLERDNIKIELPFEIILEHFCRKRILDSVKTNFVSYKDMLRIKYGYAIFLGSRKNSVSFKPDDNRILKIKCQMGEWWEVKGLKVTMTEANCIYIINLLPQVEEKAKNYDIQIENLQRQLYSMPMLEEEKE